LQKKIGKIVEMMLAYLSDRFGKMGHMRLGVEAIPEEKQRYANVRYAFKLPFGDGGFYQ
jgi:hypothetical protein